MSEILDHDYINEFAELNFGENGSGFLEVNQPAWQEELYRLERIRNAGCMVALVLLVVSIFFPIPGKWVILLIGIILLSKKEIQTPGNFQICWSMGNTITKFTKIKLYVTQTLAT
ncbi:MAG: hypothetical protein AAF502_21415 [Bacteroidota bacterium]